MTLRSQSSDWYNRLMHMQPGYFYPWRSMLEPLHGEDVFHNLVFQHLRPEMDVLEIACAQGDLALEMAAGCRSVLAYDRAAPWIDAARAAARQRGVANAAFIHHDSSRDANGGRAYIPAAERSFDLLVCSKGPFHWIEDARRVARPGAVMLMLVPDATPLTAWTDQLPAPLRWQESDPHWARPAIEQRLGASQLALHSWWSFDVPEIFTDPRELYVWLAWGTTPDEVPSYAKTAPLLEKIFRQSAGPQGLEIRRRRFIWKAVVPEN